LSAISEDLSVAAIGSPETVQRQLTEIADRYQADELILTAGIHDHAARVKSFAIGAEVLKQIIAA